MDLRRQELDVLREEIEKPELSPGVKREKQDQLDERVEANEHLGSLARVEVGALRPGSLISGRDLLQRRHQLPRLNRDIAGFTGRCNRLSPCLDYRRTRPLASDRVPEVEGDRLDRLRHVARPRNSLAAA